MISFLSFAGVREKIDTSLLLLICKLDCKLFYSASQSILMIFCPSKSLAYNVSILLSYSNMSIKETRPHCFNIECMGVYTHYSWSQNLFKNANFDFDKEITI